MGWGMWYAWIMMHKSKKNEQNMKRRLIDTER